MKNYLPLVALIGVLVVLGGCSKNQSDQKTVPTNQPEQENNQPAPQNNSTNASDSATATPEQQTEPAANGTFQNIKDAIAKSLPVKCEYKDEDGKLYTAYIKGEKIKTEGIVDEGRTFNALIVDKKLYTWDIASKQGLMFDLATVKEPETDENPGATQLQSEDDIIKKIEEGKQNCSVTAIDETTFKIPEDVTFSTFEIPVMPQLNNQ